jgi:hypothetical protein
MTLTWETQKIVYVLFGSVLALQLHNSARRVPRPSNGRAPLIKVLHVLLGLSGGAAERMAANLV